MRQTNLGFRIEVIDEIINCHSLAHSIHRSRSLSTTNHDMAEFRHSSLAKI